MAFWIQYGISFNGCFVIILQRSLIYIFTFHSNYKKMKYKETKKNVITFIFTLPLIILSLIVTLTLSCFYNNELNTCLTRIEYKLVLILQFSYFPEFYVSTNI